jgi:hypothetical protein
VIKLLFFRGVPIEEFLEPVIEESLKGVAGHGSYQMLEGKG